MRVVDHIPATGLLPRLEGQDKDDVIRRLVGALAESGAVGDQQALLAEIAARERDGGTAIGGGLAVPHARMPGIPRVQVAVATLRQPLTLASEDGRPVDVFVMIVGPEADPRQMLRILARLARMVKRGRLLADLRAAATADEMRSALVAAEDDPLEQRNSTSA